MNGIKLMLIASLFSWCAGCGAVDRTFDCASICTNYEQCIDGDLDSSDCIDRCEARGDADQSFEDLADTCDDCLEGRACAEQLSCQSTCAPVVLQSI